MRLQKHPNGYLICNAEGQIVGKMANAFKPAIDSPACTVAAVLVRYRSDNKNEAHFGRPFKCDRWELVVPRLESVV